METKQSTLVSQYIRVKVNVWDQPRKFCLQITEAQRNYQVREESSEDSEGFTRRIHQSINPFSGELDKSQLYNLSSGIPVPEDLAEMILRTTEDGHNEYSSFLEN